MNTHLGKLTHGEWLWLWRHEHNMTQEQAAAGFGVCLSYYQLIERDKRKQKLLVYRGRGIGGWEPTGGRCPLARRRFGLDLRWVARAAGFSHRGYLLLERANDPRIVAFWRQHGFTFPA